VRQYLYPDAFVQSSDGVTLTDLDGNRFYDLTGSYGVNLYGYDFYKGCIERGSAQVRALGPVLGAYHPAVAHNVRRLKEISRQDEVSRIKGRLITARRQGPGRRLDTTRQTAKLVAG
jgi:glutamate-1-semialdehyde 2,1-aminomutase